MTNNLTEIIELLGELTKEHRDKGGTLFIHGNLTDDVIVNALKGDMTVLAMAFGNQMRDNEEFNQTMITMFASFLVNHPDQKEAFIRTLEHSPMAPGVN